MPRHQKMGLLLCLSDFSGFALWGHCLLHLFLVFGPEINESENRVYFKSLLLASVFVDLII